MDQYTIVSYFKACRVYFPGCIRSDLILLEYWPQNCHVQPGWKSHWRSDLIRSYPTVSEARMRDLVLIKNVARSMVQTLLLLTKFIFVVAETGTNWKTVLPKHAAYSIRRKGRRKPPKQNYPLSTHGAIQQGCRICRLLLSCRRETLWTVVAAAAGTAANLSRNRY